MRPRFGSDRSAAVSGARLQPKTLACVPVGQAARKPGGERVSSYLFFNIEKRLKSALLRARSTTLNSRRIGPALSTFGTVEI